MHISEAYEHETMMPYQVEKSCPVKGCDRVGNQCVNVSAPVRLTPVAVVGTITVTCQGAPTVTCVTDEKGTSSTVTFTQKVCVSVPIHFSVTPTPEDPKIACADSSVGCMNCC